MKRKTREEKGITLVALIITIIVLLILAVVAIRAVTGDGIIAHAKNAQTKYEEAQAEEEGILSYYNEYLETKGNVGPWKQEGDNITMKDDNGNPINIPIGAKVNYDPTAGVTDSNLLQYTSSSAKTGIAEEQVFKASNTLYITTTSTETIEWRVLGIEHGKIKLVASKGIAPVDTANEYVQSSGYVLKGKDGYNNAIQESNNICATFGYGKGAESARSISGVDIEKIARIAETDKEASSGVCVYGNKYTYKYENGSIKLSENGGPLEDLQIQEVYFPDEVINSENPGPKTVTNDYFYVDLTARIENSNLKNIILNGEITLIAERCAAILKEDNTQYAEYKRGYMQFYIKVIDGRKNATNTMNYYTGTTLYDYWGDSNYSTERIKTKLRPVVILKADTVLTKDGEGYNIR